MVQLRTALNSHRQSLSGMLLSLGMGIPESVKDRWFSLFSGSPLVKRKFIELCMHNSFRLGWASVSFQQWMLWNLSSGRVTYCSSSAHSYYIDTNVPLWKSNTSLCLHGHAMLQLVKPHRTSLASLFNGFGTLRGVSL